MKVFVVVETYFNGEGDSKCVAAIFSSMVLAEAFVADKTKGIRSPYSPTYDIEEFTVDGAKV